MANEREPISKTQITSNSITMSDLWPVSIDRYHEMVIAGLLTDDDPLELIDGYLVKKVRKSPAHCATTGLLLRALNGLVGPGLCTMSQCPITMTTSEPEPDIIVVRGDLIDYANRHPSPQDVKLVVEVSEMSLERDLGWKRCVYADAGIQQYWVVNLVDRRLEVFEKPTGNGQDATFSLHISIERMWRMMLEIDGKELGSFAINDIIVN